MKTNSRPTLRRRILISIGMLLLVVFSTTAWLFWPTTTWARVQELNEAERRWSLRQFGSYHLELTDKRCPQKIDVRNERVIRVAPNRCDAPPRSITDLFTLIRRDGSVAQECIFRGCICDDVIRIEATYDAQLGYPSKILVRIKAHANWRHPDFWKKAWQTKSLPSCDAMVEGSKVIQVVAMTPVQ